VIWAAFYFLSKRGWTEEDTGGGERGGEGGGGVGGKHE